ncbi:enoyl-CoA hydratase/isomerase family protein [Chloroflexota bacterium]
MSYETILVDKDGYITTITLNRPDRLNVVSQQMIQELSHVFNDLREDDETRFVIITGEGRIFSAGADLNDSRSAAERGKDYHVWDRRRSQKKGHEFMKLLESLEQVTIVAFNGLAVGAGIAMSQACDFRIAAESASFLIAETNIGIFYTYGSTPRLVRLIGPAKAKELIMTAETIDAQEALRIGLVNKVVPDRELMGAAHEMIGKIASRAPVAVRMTKMIVNAVSKPTIGDVSLYEPDLVERLYLSDDPREGLAAFFGKRKPSFTGK